ncbi:hypothetical protein Bca101_019273 [Brassica carinata]
MRSHASHSLNPTWVIPKTASRAQLSPLSDCICTAGETFLSHGFSRSQPGEFILVLPSSRATGSTYHGAVGVFKTAGTTRSTCSSW